MGQKLIDFYTKAEALGGMKAKMRLAMITAMPSLVAKSQEDTPELLAKFIAALKVVEKEYK